MSEDRAAFPREVPEMRGLSWVSEEDIDFLLRWIPESGRFLEVGSASGVTASLIADARPSLALTCVDSYPDLNGEFVQARDPNRIVNWYENRRPNMQLWLGTLPQFSRVCRPSLFNAIFIDGDHTYRFVYSDLTIAERLLAPGGVLIMHDYGIPRWPDVARAAEDFRVDYGFEIADTMTYLCVLRRCG